MTNDQKNEALELALAGIAEDTAHLDEELEGYDFNSYDQDLTLALASIACIQARLNQLMSLLVLP